MIESGLFPRGRVAAGSVPRGMRVPPALAPRVAVVSLKNWKSGPLPCLPRHAFFRSGAIPRLRSDTVHGVAHATVAAPPTATFRPSPILAADFPAANDGPLGRT
jgi:hypothetical protein